MWPTRGIRQPPNRKMPPKCSLGGRIKGTLGDIDPLNKVPLKRARSRVQKGYPLRGLPNTTPYSLVRRKSETAELQPGQHRGLNEGSFGWGYTINP